MSKTKKVLRKRRMKAARQFAAAALREPHAPDRAAAYAEREAKVAAKEAERLVRQEPQPVEEEA